MPTPAVRRPANAPTRTRSTKRASTPEGYAAQANRRSNAETGNHAFKAILGDQAYNKNAASQQNEMLCIAIAYNLKRLVYLSVVEDVEVDFSGGADVLRETAWQTLGALKTLVVPR